MKFKIYNLFLLAFLFSYVVCIDVKSHRLFTDTVPVLKYFPIILSSLVLFRNFRLSMLKINFVIIALILFFMMLSGSLYTILILREPLMNSFLGRSLNMITFFSSAFFFLNARKKDIEIFARKYIKLTMWIVSLYVFLSIIYVLIGRPEFLKNGEQLSRQLYHEELSYLIPSWIFFFFFRKKLRFFLSLLLGIFSFKITGYILTFVNIYMFVKTIIIQRMRDIGKLLFKSVFYFLGFGTILLVITLYKQLLKIRSVVDVLILQLNGKLNPRDIGLPIGNLGVRFLTYDIRIHEFLKSPFWGSFFSGNPNIEIGNHLYIPSHSDILDILAFSGVIGFLLFITLNIFALSKWKTVFLTFKNTNSILTGCLFLYSVLIVISYILTLSFNPIILHPSISFFYWFWLGFNLSISYRFITNKVVL